MLSFPSIWKTSIIPIHKLGKPLDSPASFQPISLTSCVSKLFEHIIPSRLLFFLESNSILSFCQASFHPERSTLDQILYLSQSISDGFNKPRPGSRTILATIDFSKAFDSVWHAALFHKLISAGLLLCFAHWTQSFLSDRSLVWFIKITKIVSFKSVEVFCKDLFLARYFSLSSSTIFRLLCLLSSAALFMLTIWPFGPPPPRSPLQWRPHKELCFDWNTGLITGVLLSIQANVRPPSSQWIPNKPTSSYSALTSISIPLQLFFGSPSIALIRFQNMHLCQRPSFSHVSRLYAVSMLSHGASLRSPSLLYKGFVQSLTNASPGMVSFS